MRRIIKQGLVVALALGTLGSTAWASDEMSRWEGFCYAMQADVNEETIKQAPPPDVTPFQEALDELESVISQSHTEAVLGTFFNALKWFGRKFIAMQ